ncbi:MAG TPA: Gfo/Idh/MocA family oxidoreductase [Lacipirellulaceae bacterium]|nr:Gfo/Idh/MocA family oxidoreductase [Lacipirellulaceae bacterium]
MKTNRREFFKRSAAAGALAAIPYSLAQAKRMTHKEDNRPTVAAIGVGGVRGAFSRGSEIGFQASKLGRMIAVCDVDVVNAANFSSKFNNKLAMYSDYRELLERERPQIVTIGTPDHWHVPIAISALRAGCDVYCEKPLTLTLDENFRIRKEAEKSGRVFQVGTQQRSLEMPMFVQAIAIVKSGRLGKKVNAHVAIGGSPTGGPFPATKPPEGLNWDMWVGGAQPSDYSEERRKEFRWFFDYSGGKMTDWGAHHIDIAQWGLGHDHSGPVRVSAKGKFGTVVPEHFNWLDYFASKAKLKNGYQTATKFDINLEYADGSYIHVCDEYTSPDGKTKFGNGILFEGEDGRIFVDRGDLKGKPVEEMTKADKVKLHEAVVKLNRGKEPTYHMQNFFDCVASRDTPISDVKTHVRTMTCCHLCNIGLMLGRDLHWDPEKEQFVDDEEATKYMSRRRREKYSWKATT